MKKFENILIVTDLDGTFLSSRDTTVERNLTAIEYFKKNGGHFTVASGRVFEHIIGAIPNIGELVNTPVITCNGACLYDTKTDTALESHALDFQTVKEIYELVIGEFPNVGMRAGALEYCFMFTPEGLQNNYLAGDYERYKKMHCRVLPFSRWSENPILKVVLRGDSDTLDRLLSVLEERLDDKASASKSWATVVDVQAGGVNKGRALTTLAKKYLPNGICVYACGDYINDTDLLLSANVAVCPSNAHEYIKSISDLCLCSNDGGLIGELVEKLDREI